MKAHIDYEDAMEARAHQEMFRTEHQRYMLVHLLDGSLATQGPRSDAARIVQSGVPALPVTPQFARWLSFNATRTADTFQQMSFDYSGKSSNAVDSFATQIQGMVKKIQGFIKMMERYSTPTGIRLLQAQFRSFAVNAARDVVRLIRRKFARIVNRTAPVVNKALNSAVDLAGKQLGNKVGSLI